MSEMEVNRGRVEKRGLKTKFMCVRERGREIAIILIVLQPSGTFIFITKYVE